MYSPRVAVHHPITDRLFSHSWSFGDGRVYLAARLVISATRKAVAGCTCGSARPATWTLIRQDNHVVPCISSGLRG